MLGASADPGARSVTVQRVAMRYARKQQVAWRRVAIRHAGIDTRNRVPFVVLAAFLAALLALAGCSGPSSAGGAERRVPVTAESGASASVDGLTVEIAPGDVAGTGTLTVRRWSAEGSQDPRPPVDLPQGMTLLGDGMEASLGGAVLAADAEAVITVEPPDSGAEFGTEASESIYVLLWRDPSSGWRALPTERSRGGAFVARTNLFSRGFLARIDAREWARQHLAAADAYFSGRADVAPPSCGDEQATRGAGIEVISDPGDAVTWCFGFEDGRQVLKVANNRRTFTEVTFPEAWDVVDDGARAVPSDALARALDEGVVPPAEPGREAWVVGGGATLTLVVPPRSSGVVTAQAGSPAWALSAIAFGLDVYAFAAKALGLLALAQSATTLPGRLLDRIAGTEDLGGYTEPLQACGQAFAGQVTDGATGDDLVAGIRAIWQCLPGLMQADAAETGVTFSGLPAALNLLDGVVALVLTAGNLLGSEVGEAVA